MRSGTAAYVSTSREIRLLSPEGRDTALTGADGGLLWGAWGAPSPSSETFSWPTWSPDGRRIACFRLPNGTGDRSDDAHPPGADEAAAPVMGPEPAVMVYDADGVSSTALMDLGGRLPIYLHWSPSGKQVAVLAQQAEQLHLSTAALDDPGQEHRLAQGSPLFFTWTREAGAERIAAFVGSPSGSRPKLSLLDPSDAAAGGRHLPGVPGNFCAPLWVGGRVVYVLHEGDTTRVVSAEVGADRSDHIETVDGLVAMVASPDGRTLARAVAPGGDGTPYRDLALIDVATREVRAIVDTPCLAYLWAPAGKRGAGGERLVVARVDTKRNLLEWLRVDLDGRTEHLCDMYPTRDLGFYLRFFEQYTQSHALVDPAGSRLLLAGTVLGRGPGRANPKLWDISLDDGTLDEVGDGVFAVFAP